MKFVCKKCNYRFKSDIDRTKGLCPYCGKREVIKEPDAEELVKEGE